MDLKYALLADAAEAVNGKLYVLGGGISIMWRDRFPAPMDVSLVLHFDYDQSEVGRPRRLEIRLTDADGSVLIPPLDTQLVPGERAPGVPSTVPLSVVIAARIAGPPIIPQPGTYAVAILLDGNHVESVRFEVVIPQPVAMPPQPPRP